MILKGKRGEKEKLLAHLEKIAQRVKLHNPGAHGVEISVVPATASGDTYAVEFSRERVSRRVVVDTRTVARLLAGTPDVALVRELRTALLAVIARARQKEQD